MVAQKPEFIVAEEIAWATHNTQIKPSVPFFKEDRGGEGSGNFKHKGRPGEVGGSAEGTSINVSKAGSGDSNEKWELLSDKEKNKQGRKVQEYTELLRKLKPPQYPDEKDNEGYQRYPEFDDELWVFASSYLTVKLEKGDYADLAIAEANVRFYEPRLMETHYPYMQAPHNLAENLDLDERKIFNLAEYGHE